MFVFGRLSGGAATSGVCWGVVGCEGCLGVWLGGVGCCGCVGLMSFGMSLVFLRVRNIPLLPDSEPLALVYAWTNDSLTSKEGIKASRHHHSLTACSKANGAGPRVNEQPFNLNGRHRGGFLTAALFWRVYNSSRTTHSSICGGFCGTNAWFCKHTLETKRFILFFSL